MGSAGLCSRWYGCSHRCRYFGSERLCDIYADILQLRDTIAVEGRTYTVQTEGGFFDKGQPGSFNAG